MKKHYLLISIWVVTLFYLSIIMASKSYAQTGIMNRGENEIRMLSEQAGSFIFRGYSTIYQAIEQLELRNVKGANDILQWKAKPLFETEASKLYGRILEYDTKNPRVLRQLPPNQLEIFEKDFSRFPFSTKVDIPKNTMALSQATLQAMKDFTDVLKRTQFTENDYSKNRDLVRDLSEMIFNLTTLGLSFSELAWPVRVSQ
jgi:hypothetical protein